MKQKHFMLKTVASTLLALSSLGFIACGDNSIEVENEKQVNFSFDMHAAMDSLKAQRGKTDYYACYEKTRGIVDDYRLRCDNFLNLYGKGSVDTVLSLATVIKMVKDEDNYDNKGRFIGENPDPYINYLLFSKMLSVTLSSYKQTVDSISSADKIGDPEIRFMVKSYIDNEPSEYDPYSALALDTVEVKEWKGEKKVSIVLPRGIDAIELCPILRDKNEHDDYYDDEDLLRDSDCISIKNLGWVKENETKSQTTEGEKATISWQWFIYSMD